MCPLVFLRKGRSGQEHLESSRGDRLGTTGRWAPERQYWLRFGWVLLGVENGDSWACDYITEGFHRARTGVKQAGCPRPPI